MIVGWVLSALGLLCGAGLGVYALLFPRRVTGALGFAFDPAAPGGIGEARAFGGFIVGSQAAALAMAILAILETAGAARGAAAQVTALALIAPAALVWACAGAARLGSILIDKQGTGLNWRLFTVDATLALMIAMPWAMLMVR